MIYTNQFLLLLKDIDKNKPCEITTFLLENQKLETNITWIDIEDDLISFVSDRKLKQEIALMSEWERNMLKSEVEFEKNMKEWISKGELKTTKIKIGRFINRITNQFTDSQIEKFVNNFKAFLKLKKDCPNFQIISGEEIKKYYHEDSYQYDKGQLSLSCMRHDSCQDYFRIYTENPEICQLIILKGINTDKIIGRALLWTLTNGEKYLDRVYTSFDFDMILFEEYAKTLGCNLSYDKIYKGKSKKFVELTIKPRNIDFDLYPFMDTFRYFYPSKKIFNSEILDSNNHYYDMDITNGELTSLASIRNLPPLRYINLDIQAA